MAEEHSLNVSMSKEQEDFQVTLKLNAEQARIVSQATELLARLHLGQIGHVMDEIIMRADITVEQAERIRELSELLGTVITDMPPNASFGIGSPKVPDRARVAFDIYQAVRNRLAYVRKPEGGMQVSFDAPSKLSEQPLPEVTVSSPRLRPKSSLREKAKRSTRSR